MNERQNLEEFLSKALMREYELCMKEKRPRQSELTRPRDLISYGGSAGRERNGVFLVGKNPTYWYVQESMEVQAFDRSHGPQS